MRNFKYGNNKIGNPAYQAFFYCLKRGEWPNTNEKDSILNAESIIEKQRRQEIRRNFAVWPKEKLLYYRETSWFSHNAVGLVLTDFGIHYIQYTIEDLQILQWSSIKKVTDDDENIIFLLHDNSKINIGKEAFIKKYIWIEEEKQKRVSKFLCSFLQTISDSMPYIAPINYQTIIKKSKYQLSVSTHAPIDKLIQRVYEYDINTMSYNDELRPYLKVINQFDDLQKSISKRFGKIKNDIQQSTQQIKDICRYVAYNAIQRSKSIIPKGQHAGETGIALLIYAAVDLYNDMRQNMLEYEEQNISENLEKMRKLWFEDNINKLAHELKDYNTNLENIQPLYQTFLLREDKIENISNSEVQNAFGCFVLYCRIIYAQQWTLHFLKTLDNVYKEKNDNQEQFSLEQIVQSEFEKLLNREVTTSAKLVPIYQMFNQ